MKLQKYLVFRQSSSYAKYFVEPNIFLMFATEKIFQIRKPMESTHKISKKPLPKMPDTPSNKEGKSSSAPICMRQSVPPQGVEVIAP